MYDPTVGQFIEEDPIGFDDGGTNLYTYCGNNPTNETDPSGLAPIVALPATWITEGIIGPRGDMITQGSIGPRGDVATDYNSRYAELPPSPASVGAGSPALATTVIDGSIPPALIDRARPLSPYDAYAAQAAMVRDQQALAAGVGLVSSDSSSSGGTLISARVGDRTMSLQEAKLIAKMPATTPDQEELLLMALSTIAKANGAVKKTGKAGEVVDGTTLRQDNFCEEQASQVYGAVFPSRGFRFWKLSLYGRDSFTPQSKGAWGEGHVGFETWNVVRVDPILSTNPRGSPWIIDPFWGYKNEHEEVRFFTMAQFIEEKAPYQVGYPDTVDELQQDLIESDNGPGIGEW